MTDLQTFDPELNPEFTPAMPEDMVHELARMSQEAVLALKVIRHPESPNDPHEIFYALSEIPLEGGDELVQVSLSVAFLDLADTEEGKQRFATQPPKFTCIETALVRALITRIWTVAHLNREDPGYNEYFEEAAAFMGEVLPLLP